MYLLFVQTDRWTDGVDPLLDLCFPMVTQVKIMWYTVQIKNHGFYHEIAWTHSVPTKWVQAVCKGYQQKDVCRHQVNGINFEHKLPAKKA